MKDFRMNLILVDISASRGRTHTLPEPPPLRLEVRSGKIGCIWLPDAWFVMVTPAGLLQPSSAGQNATLRSMLLNEVIL